MRMPERKHLRRLEAIFAADRLPLFLVTCCVARRARVLARDEIPVTLCEAWQDAATVHGWLVGRYVVMPDHVHFFCAPRGKTVKDLSAFIGGWKQWTGRRIRQRAVSCFRWQREFFDHLLRSEESYAEKWEYVRQNPVRAQLVNDPDEWPYQAEVATLAP